jgi:hypothetical protein
MGLGSITSLTAAKGRVFQGYEYQFFGIPKHHGHTIHPIENQPSAVSPSYTYT